jgi:AraC-like DNA-binding protein
MNGGFRVKKQILRPNTVIQPLQESDNNSVIQNADMYNIHPLFCIEYCVHDANHSMTNAHYHSSYELYVLEKGYHDVLINDSIFDIGMFDVVLYKPNVFHKSLQNQGCARTCIYFSDRYLNQHFTVKSIYSLLSCFENNIITLDKETFPKFKSLMLLLEKENLTDPDNRIFIYLADLLNILNENKKTPKPENFASPYNNFAPILSYINQNYNKINNIEEIADRFFISKFYLCHLFKEVTGLTLIQYLNKIKVQNACNMLVNTELSISEIGMECGFNSSMYFCKTFKQELKVTPREFRTRART